MSHEHLNYFLISDWSFEAELDFQSGNSPARSPSLVPDSLFLYRLLPVSCVQGLAVSQALWALREVFQNIRALGP